MEENKTMEQEPEIQEEEVKAEDTAEATEEHKSGTEDKEKLPKIHRYRHLRNICRCFCKTSKR